eukprot:GFUD01088915.1.p1 GENE.GFUD01088915.1~~GFUD01088915.1.p1  ORF type:complete len:109 (+),score=2.60 GFUD01088915.1:35-328(+)
MFCSILLCSFLAYVSTTAEGTDGWLKDTDRSCKCNGMMVMQTGWADPVGECTQSKDGRPFCFVNPSACQYLVQSPQFPGLYLSYAACEVQSFSSIGL